jgi:hypothetical protein
LKNSLVQSGERMPGEEFSFRPTPEIRSFGEILGHMANQNYRSCAAAGGEVNPNHVNIEREKTSKADVVKALQESFAFCDKVYGALTDADASKLMGTRARLSILSINNAHNYEHYGNLVVYLRLKGIIPLPSFSPRASTDMTRDAGQFARGASAPPGNRPLRASLPADSE